MSALLRGITSFVSASVPQSQPLDTRQVRNNAGGFVYKVSDMQRLARLICLGTEKGSYYVGEKQLSLESAQSVVRLLEAGKGAKVVETVAQYSVEGRTAKQDNILFVLALCAKTGDEETKRAAYAVLTQVCRIPTTLFAFVDACEKIAQSSRATSGWGRAHRRGIAEWYSTKPSRDLAYHVTKYKNRNGWTHTDVLRLVHPKSEPGSGHHLVYKYIIKGWSEVCKENFTSNTDMDTGSDSSNSAATKDIAATLDFLTGVEEMLQLGRTWVERLSAEPSADKSAPPFADLVANAVALIRRHGLAREHLPTEILGVAEVWETLLETMPMTAMIRNLGKMSSLGLFEEESSPSLARVLSALKNKDQLRRARVHPLHVLTALNTYKAGKGDRGSLTWPVNKQIESALDEAFYLSFHAVEPTGKRFLLGIDVSGSMGCANVNGISNLTARDAAAAMAMVTLRTEPFCRTMAFCNTLVPLNINKNMTLDKVIGSMSNLPFGSTDCAQPMLYALKNNIAVDTFIVYTDNETWCGGTHPTKALNDYRLKMNIDAKLIVVAFSVSNFSIADPDDAGMLDMPGFDASAPEVMRSFILGEI